MGMEIDKLARFVAEARWSDIPRDVQHHTKLVLLDTLGVILAGSVRPEVSAVRDRLAGSGGPATILAPGWPGSDARTAALLNGIAGRSIELCEGLRLVSGQVALQVLPGALAVAEQTGATGADLLTAFIVGYEIGGRLCAAFTARPLAHQNGQASLLGAAAAGARLRGLDATATSLALRIATTLMLSPSYTNAVNGATALNIAGGMSGFAAAIAPELALAGFTAQEDAVEQSLGSLIGSAFSADGLLDDLGERWEIMRNYFRLYACCNPIHPALDCLQALLAELKPRPEEVERIEVATYRFASVMRDPEPSNYFASKYSLPHAAAAMIVNGNAGHASLDDAALSNPVIAALRRRVHVTEDPAMTAVAPRLRPARVQLVLKDGRSAVRGCTSHRGDFNEPFAEAEIRAKFCELASVTLSTDGARAVEKAVFAGEDWPDPSALTTLLRQHSRRA